MISITSSYIIITKLILNLKMIQVIYFKILFVSRLKLITLVLHTLIRNKEIQYNNSIMQGTIITGYLQYLQVLYNYNSP